MRVFRFMSNSEFEMYKTGKVLVNNNNHREKGFKSDSVGFCFFDESEIDIKQAIHFLSGLVSFDICAVFETDKNNLKQGYGVYKRNCKPTGNLGIDLVIALMDNNTMRRTEYSTKTYSKENFKLIKFSKKIWEQYTILEKQKDLKWEECNV